MIKSFCCQLDCFVLTNKQNEVINFSIVPQNSCPNIIVSLWFMAPLATPMSVLQIPA